MDMPFVINKQKPLVFVYLYIYKQITHFVCNLLKNKTSKVCFNLFLILIHHYLYIFLLCYVQYQLLIYFYVC